MRIVFHEYANEADDDDDDVPKPAQSLGTPVPRQKLVTTSLTQLHMQKDQPNTQLRLDTILICH